MHEYEDWTDADTERVLQDDEIDAAVEDDVDLVLSYALTTVWADPKVARDWLNTPNGHLDGRKPIQRIKAGCTAEVIDALRAEASGAYA